MKNTQLVFTIILLAGNKFCVELPDRKRTHSAAYERPLFFIHNDHLMVALTDYWVGCLVEASGVFEMERCPIVTLDKSTD